MKNLFDHRVPSDIVLYPQITTGSSRGKSQEKSLYNFCLLKTSVLAHRVLTGMHQTKTCNPSLRLYSTVDEHVNEFKRNGLFGNTNVTFIVVTYTSTLPPSIIDYDASYEKLFRQKALLVNMRDRPYAFKSLRQQFFPHFFKIEPWTRIIHKISEHMISCRSLLQFSN